MRPRKDVVVYGANPASVEALRYILGVRLHVNVIAVASLDEVKASVCRSTNFGCAIIACHAEEKKRLKAFVRACGPAQTLEVRLGAGRVVESENTSPCTVSVAFLAMGSVLDRVQTLCSRKRGPKKLPATAPGVPSERVA